MFLKSSISEIEIWQTKFTKLEAEGNDKALNFLNMLSLLEMENERLKKLLSQNEEELNSLRTQTKRLSEIEIQLTQITKEYESVTMQIPIKDEELKSWMEKCKKLEEELEEAKGNQNLIDDYTKRISELMFEVESLTKSDEENKKEITMYRQKFLDMSSVTEQMNQFLAIYVVLFAELDSLRNRIKEKEQENIDLRRKSFMPKPS